MNCWNTDETRTARTDAGRSLSGHSARTIARSEAAAGRAEGHLGVWDRIWRTAAASHTRKHWRSCPPILTERSRREEQSAAVCGLPRLVRVHTPSAAQEHSAEGLATTSGEQVPKPRFAGAGRRMWEHRFGRPLSGCPPCPRSLSLDQQQKNRSRGDFQQIAATLIPC